MTIGERVKGGLLPSKVAATETYFSCQMSAAIGPKWFSTRIRACAGTSIRMPSSATLVEGPAPVAPQEETNTMQIKSGPIAEPGKLETIPFKFKGETKRRD